MNVQNGRSVEEIVAAIQALDLEPIKVKLMDADEGQGWTLECVNEMEVAYKRFLTLLVTHPETPIAPSKDIDKFWHGHILDTMKYAEDCENVFGYFLHHFPYFGMRGEQDAAALKEAGEATARLYERDFGEPMPAPKGHSAAFCFAAEPKAQAAFCFAARKADAAFCFASKPVANEVQAAFCFAAQPKTEAAFCFAAKKADAAFCFAARPAARIDVNTRPTLALAA